MFQRGTLKDLLEVSISVVVGYHVEVVDGDVVVEADADD